MRVRILKTIGRQCVYLSIRRQCFYDNKGRQIIRRHFVYLNFVRRNNILTDDGHTKT